MKKIEVELTPAPEQKLQAIVEATPGMCWHENTTYNTSGPVHVTYCDDCKIGMPHKHRPNPDSVDDLLKIAERLGYYASVRRSKLHNGRYAGDLNTPTCIHTTLKDTPAEALLEALYRAVFSERKSNE